MMWRVYKALNRMEHSYLLNDSQTRDNRCKALIVALLQELGTGFMRITMGAETLIENCCDPDKSYLDFKPEITAAEKDQARYQYLRSRDLETIDQGGLFVGMTPVNIVINLTDLDELVDAAMKKEAPCTQPI